MPDQCRQANRPGCGGGPSWGGSILTKARQESHGSAAEAPRKQTAAGCYSSRGRSGIGLDTACAACFRETACEVENDSGDGRPVVPTLNDCSELADAMTRAEQEGERAEYWRTAWYDCNEAATKLKKQLRTAQAFIDRATAHAEMDRHHQEQLTIELTDYRAAQSCDEATIAELTRRELELERIGSELARAAREASRPTDPQAEAGTWEVLDDAIDHWWSVVPGGPTTGGES